VLEKQAEMGIPEPPFSPVSSRCLLSVCFAPDNMVTPKRLGYRGELLPVDIPEQQAEKWQREELAALQSLYPDIQQALLKRKLPRAYLSQRGIPFDLVETLGIGYLPHLAEQQLKRYPQLKKWQNRLIFPYKPYAGDIGYLGRSLMLWRPGMDENEHKRLLDEQDIRRYEKTWRAGLFYQRPLETYEHINLVEGPFDWLALLAEGLTDSVALAGTDIEIAALPLNVASVTLAFDSDQAGIEAAQKLAKEMRRHGIPAEICTSPADGKGKDWSERYRLHGREGLITLFKAEPPEVCSLCSNEVYMFVEDGSEYGKPYCEAHYLALQQPGLTQEQFQAIVEQLASAWPGEIEIGRIEPIGSYTLEDQVREIEEQQQAYDSDMWQARRKARAS
jgi:DNA primase